MEDQSEFTEEDLENKLRILDNAIEVVTTNRKQNLLLLSDEIIRTGEYYKIDTQPKRVSCPKCFKDLSESMLRKHVNEECTSNEVKCTAIGCQMIMCASDLKKHLANDCQVTKKRRWLAKQSKVRAIEERKKKAEEDERRYLSRKKATDPHRGPPTESYGSFPSPRPADSSPREQLPSDLEPSFAAAEAVEAMPAGVSSSAVRTPAIDINLSMLLLFEFTN